jgi:hypothetical protein
VIEQLLETLLEFTLRSLLLRSHGHASLKPTITSYYAALSLFLVLQYSCNPQYPFNVPKISECRPCGCKSREGVTHWQQIPADNLRLPIPRYETMVYNELAVLASREMVAFVHAATNSCRILINAFHFTESFCGCNCDMLTCLHFPSCPTV